MGRSRKEAEVLPTGHNGMFELWFYDPRVQRRRHISTGTRDFVTAQGKFAEFLTTQRRMELDGTLPTDADAPDKGNPTVEQCYDFYWAEHIVRWRHDEKTCRTSWKPLKRFWAQKRISELRSDYLSLSRAYRRMREAEGVMEHGALRIELIRLNAVLNFAVENGFITGARWHRLKTKEPKRRTDWLEVEEVQRFLVAAGLYRINSFHPHLRDRLSRLERFLAIIVHTGQRNEAARYLVWDRVDWEANTLDFRYDDVVPTRIMRNKKQDVIEMPNRLRSTLERAWDERLPGKGRYVLDSRTHLATQFDRVRDTLPPRFATVTPHTFRHTWATWARRRGDSFEDIAATLSISTAQAERTYAHITRDVLKRVANVTDALGPATVDDELKASTP